MRWYKWLCLLILVISTPMVVQGLLAAPARIGVQPLVGVTMLIGNLLIPTVCLLVLLKKKKK